MRRYRAALPPRRPQVRWRSFLPLLLVCAVVSSVFGWIGVLLFFLGCLGIAFVKIGEHHDYRVWQRRVRRAGGWPTGLLTVSGPISETRMRELRSAFRIARDGNVSVVSTQGTFLPDGTLTFDARPVAHKLIGLPATFGDVAAPHDVYVTSDQPYRLLRRFVTARGVVFYRDCQGREVICADSGRPPEGGAARLRAHVLAPGSVDDREHPIRRSAPYSIQGWESKHPLVYTRSGRLLPGASDDAEMLARMPGADQWGANALPPKTGDPLAVGEELRDPLWSETVETMRQERGELISRLRACEYRVRSWKRVGPYPDVDAHRELVAAQDELALIRGDLLAAMEVPRFPGDVNTVDGQPKVHHGVLPSKVTRTMDQWLKVPRDTVIVLPRAVHAACDCRYGHYAYHRLLTRESDGAAMRECTLCQPPTRWIETGASA